LFVVFNLYSLQQSPVLAQPQTKADCGKTIFLSGDNRRQFQPMSFSIIRDEGLASISSVQYRGPKSTIEKEAANLKKCSTVRRK
jgi:hypothetical protein